ncbi:WD40-repeat-containing domain [Globisporangium polare]
MRLCANSSRSERVKSVDIHPTEPRVLSALYAGSTRIRNYYTQTLAKTIQVSAGPVRTARIIIPRKNWIVTDDTTVRVFDLETNALVASFETVKVWDLATQSVVRTLVGHTNNVSAVLKHAFLPLLVSAAEDGTMRTWGATTFRVEGVLNYGLSRAWTLSALPGSVRVAIGYDHGSVVADLAAAIEDTQPQ